ncbi:MAG: ribosome recycling factor [Olsenella sp.]|jgi:ribosome recycling factor
MSEYTDAAKKQMERSIEALGHNFAKVRTGRANPHVLDDIRVNYYGQPSPINQLAGIKSDASMLIVEPWDKGLLKEIEKAISSSDLGITPSNDGSCIKLPFPKPTEERRRELAKECRKYAEAAKISVRNSRRDANGLAERDEKAGDISEDDANREKKAIQKLTDSYIDKIDELLKAKTAEVMEL